MVHFHKKKLFHDLLSRSSHNHILQYDVMIIHIFQISWHIREIGQQIQTCYSDIELRSSQHWRVVCTYTNELRKSLLFAVLNYAYVHA